MSMFDNLKSKLGIDTEADSYIDDTEDEIFAGGQGAPPRLDLHAVDALRPAQRVQRRRQPGKTGQIIHPQPHRFLAFVRQLARQPPGHADVTVVVDDRAENIP